MSQRSIFNSRFATLPIVILVLLLGASIASSEETVTLEGEVEPAAYDEEGGRLLSVSIYDLEWGSVLVTSHGKGGELLEHVGAIVRATGSITEARDDSGYVYVIEVSSYTVIEPAEPDDEWQDLPDADSDRGR
jgi:hypothetical protein